MKIVCIETACAGCKEYSRMGFASRKNCQEAEAVEAQYHLGLAGTSLLPIETAAGPQAASQVGPWEVQVICPKQYTEVD